METAYELLQIPRDASRDEIRKAYRQLQMKHHPDKNLNSAESIHMTQRLNAAYDILSNERKRKDYDAQLSMEERSQQQQRPARSSLSGPPMRRHLSRPGAPLFDPAEIQSFLEKVLRPTGGDDDATTTATTAPAEEAGDPWKKPVPIFLPLRVQLAQVYAGASVPLEIERWNMETGVKTMERETVYVNLPSGVDDNEMIVLREKGNILQDNLKGDVKLTVKVENNTPFERHGLDLVLRKTVSLKEALCGFSLEFKHLNGKSYTLNSLPGSVVSPDYRKEFPEMGLRRDAHVGKLVILFSIEFPETLTMQQVHAIAAAL